VITREDGRNTYFHNDIIYHADKLLKLPDGERLINILGADHHGYLSRLNAVMRMWGQKDIETILTQMVSLEIEENGETVVFMGSKREGQYLLLKDDFMDKVGVDAARWYFLSGDPQSAITINVKKATEQNMSNPVFYVQYAHARLCSIVQKSYDAGVDATQTFVNLDLNNSVIAYELMLKLDGYNRIVQRSASTSSVQPLKIYLYELAQIIHSFYEQEKIIDQPLEKWLAGLYLMEASIKTLRSGLELLGISAPKVMRKEA
jgi:arginyl-tRNA synthetase